MAQLSKTVTFSKGLNTDASPKNQPDGSYRDARNMVHRPDGDLETEKGTVQRAVLRPGTVAVGGCEVAGLEILFLVAEDDTAWEIGVFDGTAYHTVFSTLPDALGAWPSTLLGIPVGQIDFSSSDQVDSKARITQGDEVTVYFTSHKVGPRTLNLTDLQQYTTANIRTQSNLFLEFSAPSLEVQVVEGGSLATGAYQFYMRYLTVDGNPTTPTVPSNVYPLGDGARAAGRETYDGAPPGEDSKKGFLVNLTNLDTNFLAIQVGVARYEGVDSQARFFWTAPSQIASERASVSITEEEQFSEESVLDEVTQTGAFYNGARCLEQKDKRLILSNLTSPELQLSFQQVANNIKVRYFVRELDATENVQGLSTVLSNAFARSVLSIGNGLFRANFSELVGLEEVQSSLDRNLVPLLSLPDDPDPEASVQGFEVVAVDTVNRNIDFRQSGAVVPTVFQSTLIALDSITADPFSVDLVFSPTVPASPVGVGDIMELTSDANPQNNGQFDILSVDFAAGKATVGLSGGVSENSSTSTAIAYPRREIVVKNSKSGGSQGIAALMGSPANPTFNFNDYKSEVNSAALKGYRREEVYSFALVPVFLNNSYGFAYHIPGGNSSDPGAVGAYVSLEQYPAGFDYPSGNVRHHKMPSQEQEPLVDFSGGRPKIRALGLTFYDIVFTPEQLEVMAGFYIVRQRRDGAVNSSMLYQGVARPTFDKGGNRRLLPGGNGKVTYQDAYTDGNNYLQADRDFSYLWGHFPDFIHEARRFGTPTKVKMSNLMLMQVASGLWSDSRVYSVFYNQEDVAAPLPGGAVDILGLADVPAGSVNQTILGNKLESEATNGGTVLSLGADLLLSNRQFGNGRGELHVDHSGNGEPEGPTVLVATGGNDGFYHLELLDLFRDNPRQYGQVTDGEYVLVGEVRFSNSRTSLNPVRLPGELGPDGALDNGVADVFGGDTFISRYGLVHQSRMNGGTGDGGRAKTGVYALMYFFMESNENYNYRHYVEPEGNIEGNSFEPGTLPYYPAYQSITGSPQSGVAYPLLAFDPLLGHSTGYNKQYGYDNAIRKFFPKPLIFKEVTKFPTRHIWSDMAVEGQLSDAYRQFFPNSFFDEPGEYDYIADTFTYNDTFFVHTPKALLRAFVNEVTQQASSSGDIFTSSGQIFQIPSRRVTEDRFGYGGTTSLLAGVNTPYGRFFPDPLGRKVFRFDGAGLQEISLQGTERFFQENMDDPTDNPAMGSGYSSVYDPVDGRWALCLHGRFTVSYHVKVKAWSSFHDWEVPYGFWSGRRAHIVSGGALHSLSEGPVGNFFGTGYPASLTVAASFPEAAGMACVYDSVETAQDFLTAVGGEILEVWDRVRARTFLQNSGFQDLVLDRADVTGPDKRLASVVDRRTRFAVPRDAVQDIAVDILDPANLDQAALFLPRMREEFLLLDLVKEPTNLGRIRFIRIFGRTSAR